MYNREYTPDRITELKDQEVFVFGSNLQGSHGGGAARLAYERFGAVWGQGVGLQGRSYAIPTMQGGVETIRPYVDDFVEFAFLHPELKFLVTRIGCGIATFTPEEIAPLFEEALEYDNVILPKDFVEVLEPGVRADAASETAWNAEKDFLKPVKEVSYREITVPEGLDVARVMATGIPDLAPAYGGFRGRTLSSSRQRYAWDELLAAGINQIIDLRADYSSDFYHDLCERSGISYYHYPLSNDSIEQMLEEFPTLCALIDKGRFYIACAMGLHRTDIALSLYWVFYAADKGIAPPPLRGYKKDKGLNADKILRILNAFYKKMTEVNGEPAMPEDEFKRRKGIIKEEWKKAL